MIAATCPTCHQPANVTFELLGGFREVFCPTDGRAVVKDVPEGQPPPGVTVASRETVIPFEENDRAKMLLARLRRGPASTLDLQKNLPLIHVARQVWELRHWYGFTIKTGRLPNNVALYTLVEVR